MVDAGKVGRILAGSAFLMSHGMEHWHPDPEFFYKPGGGPILDIGPYYIGALVNLLGPVARVQAQGTKGFAERVITAQGPRTGQRIAVETPTTIMALLEFAAGAHVTLAMSWDVWKHGHPAIELYGTEGSLRVPDPNFFGGTVGFTERDGEWQDASAAGMPYGKPNYRAAVLAGVAALAGELPLPRPGRARERRHIGHAASQFRPRGAACAGGDVRHPRCGGERPTGDDRNSRSNGPPAMTDEAATALARPGASV